MLDDGRIEEAISGVDQGAGIRVIVGERTTYANGNVTDVDDVAAQHPVQGITIAGNLTQLLAAVTGVGTDLMFGPSGIGSPTLVISELSIGGT